MHRNKKQFALDCDVVILKSGHTGSNSGGYLCANMQCWEPWIRLIPLTVSEWRVLIVCYNHHCVSNIMTAIISISESFTCDDFFVLASASLIFFSFSLSSTDRRSFSAHPSRINCSTSAVKNRAVLSRLGYDLTPHSAVYSNMMLCTIALQQCQSQCQFT